VTVLYIISESILTLLILILILKDIVSSLKSLLIESLGIEIPKLVTRIAKENKITKEKYILVLGLTLLLIGSLGIL
jgi:hypothetical protein